MAVSKEFNCKNDRFTLNFLETAYFSLSIYTFVLWISWRNFTKSTGSIL